MMLPADVLQHTICLLEIDPLAILVMAPTQLGSFIPHIMRKDPGSFSSMMESMDCLSRYTKMRPFLYRSKNLTQLRVLVMVWNHVQKLSNSGPVLMFSGESGKKKLITLSCSAPVSLRSGGCISLLELDDIRRVFAPCILLYKMHCIAFENVSRVTEVSLLKN